MQKMTRPTSITIIAWIFIILGSLSVCSLIYGLFNDRMNLDFSVLMIPIGIGLLKSRSSSRGWAKFWIGLFSFVLGLLLILYPFLGDSFSLRWFDKELMGFSRHAMAIGFPIVFLSLARWMWIHLTSPATLPFFDDYGPQTENNTQLESNPTKM
jgi:hypothetical protein